ncbi:MAG: DUF983 domain-containing protein [Paracoccaceae bacterium]
MKESPVESTERREVWPAVLRGWRGKCPNCGGGPMFRSYLKVRDTCAVCGEELYHHRADDGPAWATVLLAGHVIAPTMFLFYKAFRPSGGVMALAFSGIFVTVSLFLLPRLKGMFVAVQWAKRMHGFGEARRAPAAERRGGGQSEPPAT